ncbi:unnamed protein product [Gadus morhua 'NCC']
MPISVHSLQSSVNSSMEEKALVPAASALPAALTLPAAEAVVPRRGHQGSGGRHSLSTIAGNNPFLLHVAVQAELEQVSLERQHLQETGERLRARCSDLEDQCVQHGRLHQRMKDRLQQLDRHCQSSAQQVCELLATQNQLMEERRALNQDLHM